jgi:hypothetical protein
MKQYNSEHQLLYHFGQLVRHASQGLWSWPKFGVCPMSQIQWTPVTNGFGKKLEFTSKKKMFMSILIL